MEQLTQWLLSNVWLIPLYPLAAFLIIALSRWFAQTSGNEFLLKITRLKSMGLTVLATFMGLLHTLPLVAHLINGNLQRVEVNWNWLQAGDFVLSLGYLIDPMSVMMLFVVTFISMFIQIYTHGYMKHDPGYAKFYGYLALFNFSMLGLVLSTNLFQMYVFWELVGVSSYLLIGFWFTKPSAAAACIKAFLMNRVGDFGLLIGILGFLYFTWNWWTGYLIQDPNGALLSFSGIAQFVSDNPPVIAMMPLTVIAFLIFMGPMAKSAQIPLHTWLPDAMEGPTPISALIHAATMVAAGIYLVGRVYPIFQLSPDAMTIVAWIGTITAVIAASIAITQVDIKKALAYSTCSQLGFMMAAMGCGAFGAGLFHLFTHAFFKAMLFLCSGSVIHACEDEQDMRKMGGLMSKLPITGITYLIGTISISGMLWTSGFWSKDEVLIGAQNFSPVIFWILTITAGFTSFYMFRTFFMTFTGKYRGEAHVHKEDFVMVLPLMVLAVPSLFIGFLLSGSPWLANLGIDFPSWSSLIMPPGAEHAAHAVGHGIAHGAHHVADGLFSHDEVANISILLGLGGFLAAVLMYFKPIINPDWFRKGFAPLYNLFIHKWYFDELYSAFVKQIYLVFAEASAAFDKGFIDGIVNLTGNTVMSTGTALKTLQSGKAQMYIASIFFGIVVLTLFLIYWLV